MILPMQGARQGFKSRRPANYGDICTVCTVQYTFCQKAPTLISLRAFDNRAQSRYS